MIVRSRPSFLRLFFVMRGSIVPRILPHLIGFAVYGAAVVGLLRYFDIDLEGYSLTPFGLVGVSLSIYLGFRNSAAYDRWWEARKLWGQLVYEVRNLSRAAGGLVDDVGLRRPMLMDLLAFCHLLRGGVRGTDALPQVRPLIGEDAEIFAGAVNPPDAAVRRMGAAIAKWRKDGLIDAIGYRILDERLATLSALQAGCERIAGTPLPFAYSLLLQRTAYIVCLLLPIALAPTAGWATPMFTALIAYTWFGLDALSEELEDPFGTEANDLALDGLCRVCEISVFEALGEPPPPPLAGERYYFS